MTLLLAILAAVYPDPAALGHRDYGVREAAHRALDTPLGAVVAWAHAPRNPEAAWRRARIVATWRPTRYNADVLMLALRVDPSYILRHPYDTCRLIDERRLFWSPDSYAWARTPSVFGDWSVEKDLMTVGREATRRYFNGE